MAILTMAILTMAILTMALLGHKVYLLWYTCYGAARAQGILTMVYLLWRCWGTRYTYYGDTYYGAAGAQGILTMAILTMALLGHKVYLLLIREPLLTTYSHFLLLPSYCVLLTTYKVTVLESRDRCSRLNVLKLCKYSHSKYDGRRPVQ